MIWIFLYFVVGFILVSLLAKVDKDLEIKADTFMLAWIFWPLFAVMLAFLRFYTHILPKIDKYIKWLQK